MVDPKRRLHNVMVDAWRSPYGKNQVSTPKEHKASRFTEVLRFCDFYTMETSTS